MRGTGTSSDRPVLPARLRAALSPATGIFLWTRLGLWAAAALTLAWFPSSGHSGYGTSLWVRWDSAWFIRIARHGYGSAAVITPTFFPLYPGSTAVLGRLLGGRYALAGLLIALVSCAVAFELIWLLAERRLGREGAFRTVLYLAIFPTALFLQAVYSESLYLALALAAFALAERGRWPWAALAAGLALMTRSAGVAVVAGVAVLAWPHARQLAWLLLVPVLFALFPLTLHYQAHDAWGFLHDQVQFSRHLSSAGPFGGMWDAVTALGRTPDYTTHRHALAINLECLASLVLFLALLPLVWSWLGAAYGVFATVSLLLPLSFPTRDFPLISLPRFGLVIFPFFLVLATIGRRPAAHAAIVASSALLLGIAIVQWVTFQWVA